MRKSYLPDIALALGVAGFLAALARILDQGSADYVIMLAGALVLAVRRRLPLVVLAVATVCLLVYSIRVHPGPGATFPVLIAIYTATRAGHHLLPAGAAAVYLGGTLMSELSLGGPPQEIADATGLLVGWFVAAWVTGTVSRHRAAYLQQVEERAAEAERTREETALRRAGEERLRIARELHDSLTHSISIIKVQTGVAIHLARKHREEVPEALLAIQEASGDAMRELRATLEVLRVPGDDPGSGLSRLDDLVARARSAGLPANVTISGSRRPLPAEVDRAAYRIIQEALTNIARHAGDASASITLDYLPGELVVQVDDDGQATPDTAAAPGVGLRGMRERVTALGGRLCAEPRRQGGFTVRAELPLTPVPDSPVRIPS